MFDLNALMREAEKSDDQLVERLLNALLFTKEQLDEVYAEAADVLNRTSRNHTKMVMYASKHREEADVLRRAIEKHRTDIGDFRKCEPDLTLWSVLNDGDNDE